MVNFESHIAYIESVLTAGGGVAEQLQALETKATSDAEFAEVLAFYLASKQAAAEEQAVRKASLKAMLPKQEQAVAPKGKRVSMGLVWGSLAAAVLVGALFIVPKLMQSDINPRDLAMQYVSQDIQSGKVMGSETVAVVEQAITAFNEGQYPEAVKVCSVLLLQNPKDAAALEYRARANTMLGAYDAAITDLNILAADESLAFNSANYYTALVYLHRNAAGDEQRAKELLQQVVSGKMANYKDAALILEALGE